MKHFYQIILFSLIANLSIAQSSHWLDVGPVFGQGALLGGIGYRPYFIKSIDDSILIASGNYPNIYDTIICHGVVYFENGTWNNLSELGNPYIGGLQAKGATSADIYNDKVVYHVPEHDTDTVINGSYPVYNLVKTWDGQINDTLGFLNSEIVEVKVIDNQLFVFGWFSKIDGSSCRGLARYNGSVWECLDPPFGYGGPQINDIYLFDNKLWVGGNFSNEQSEPYNEIAYLDLSDSTWHDLDSGIRQDAWARIDVFQEYNGELYIGGVFRYDMGNAGHMIMRWNPETQKFSDVGGGIFGENYAYSSLAQVQDMIVFQDELWVSGLFDWAGGIKHPSIAVWDGTNWCAFGDSIETRVWDMEIFQDELYILTDFINGDTINKVAKWIGGDFRDTCGIFPLWPHGIEDQADLSEITIYPNPVSSTLHLTFREAFLDYTIFGITGNMIERGIVYQDQGIDFFQFQQGLYILQVEGKRRQSFKVLKQ